MNDRWIGSSRISVAVGRTLSPAKPLPVRKNRHEGLNELSLHAGNPVTAVLRSSHLKRECVPSGPEWDLRMLPGDAHAFDVTRAPAAAHLLGDAELRRADIPRLPRMDLAVLDLNAVRRGRGSCLDGRRRCRVVEAQPGPTHARAGV